MQPFLHMCLLNFSSRSFDVGKNPVIKSSESSHLQQVQERFDIFSCVVSRLGSCKNIFLIFQTARLSSFVGAMAIGDLIKSTLGPKGMDKILWGTGRNEGVVEVSNFVI